MEYAAFETYMREALSLARQAAAQGEVPVGALVVGPDGAILGRGRNRREEVPDATAHAELEAIREACRTLGSWRLGGCTLFVTLEPCPMCTGAIILSRIPCLVFGAREPQTGSVGSVIDLFQERYRHEPKVYAGILAAECAALLRDFFEERR